jgi:hypothetical protein
MPEKPDYIAKTVQTRKDKDYWNDIGIAYINEKTGNITVYLNALPLGDKIILSKVKD